MVNQITEECEALYKKLNTFVKKVINRDIQPQISDLESDVTSLNNSITNLVQIQYIESGAKTINNGANVTVSHTVTACPTGYSWAWFLKEAYRCHQTDVGLSGTSLTYKLHNWSGGQSTNCYARGYLVFYPSTWNI